MSQSSRKQRGCGHLAVACHSAVSEVVSRLKDMGGGKSVNRTGNTSELGEGWREHPDHEPKDDDASNSKSGWNWAYTCSTLLTCGSPRQNQDSSSRVVCAVPMRRKGFIFDVTRVELSFGCVALDKPPGPRCPPGTPGRTPRKQREADAEVTSRMVNLDFTILPPITSSILQRDGNIAL